MPRTKLLNPYRTIFPFRERTPLGPKGRKVIRNNYSIPRGKSGGVPWWKPLAPIYARICTVPHLLEMQYAELVGLHPVAIGAHPLIVLFAAEIAHQIEPP